MWFTSNKVRLLLACERGDLRSVERYVARGAEPSTRWDDPKHGYRHDCSALMWAARFGHLDVVRFLIDHGADTSYSENGQETCCTSLRSMGIPLSVRTC